MTGVDEHAARAALNEIIYLSGEIRECQTRIRKLEEDAKNTRNVLDKNEKEVFELKLKQDSLIQMFEDILSIVKIEQITEQEN